MEKIKRKLFFWALVILFFTVAPTIILHTQGYRFDMSRGVFVYSGAVNIKSNPQSISVALNDDASMSKKLSMINSSYNISGLLPGNYNVEVSSPGFQTWNKKTDVHSGVASEFWNVVLVRSDYEKINYEDTSGIEKFFISPKNKFIAYNQNADGKMAVRIFNISSKKTEKTFSLDDWRLLDSSKKENMEWSPEEDYLSVPVEKEITAQTQKGKTAVPAKKPAEIQNAYCIIDSASDNVFNLNEFLKLENIRNVRWDPENKGYVFFLKDNSLYRANVTDAADITLIAENVSTFDLTRSVVYYLQSPNNLVFKVDLDGQSGKEQVTSAFPDSSKNISRMIIYDDQRIAFISDNKDLYIYNEGEHNSYFKLLGSSVEGVHFSDDGKKILFWSNNEISVYFLRDWNVQPTRAEDELTNVTRYSETITNVQWFKDYEHVIFNAGKYTKLIELDGRDHRNCMDVFNTKIDQPFLRYSNSLEILFYTDQEGEKPILRSIIFPEPTPILGIGG